MKLKHYLQINDISSEGFGKIIGKTRETVERYKSRKMKPNARMMIVIWRATRGAVQPNDHFEELDAAEGNGDE